MEKEKQAFLYAIITVLLWSTVASAFKISLRYLNYLDLLFFASFVSTLTLFIICLFQKKIHLLKTFSKDDYLRSLLLGFLSPFLYYCFLFKAYSLLPAQEAQPLNFIWPITLLLLSIPLLKQKVNIKNLLAIFISFTGVFIISTRGDILGFRLTNPLGVSLAVGSSIIWSLYWIYNVKDARDETIKLFLNFLFGFILVMVAKLLFQGIHIPPALGILGGVYVGLFEMGITFLTWLKALQLFKTTAQITNFIYLVPFFSLLVIHFVVGEKILPSSVIGLIFIVIGILLQRHYSRSSLSF